MFLPMWLELLLLCMWGWCYVLTPLALHRWCSFPFWLAIPVGLVAGHYIAFGVYRFLRLVLK